jgi:chromosomal replication initiation ATPase DnaA
MARQLRLNLGRDAPPSFDEFVRGPSNADAVAAIEAWPTWLGCCLALIGPQGSGKSHLALAWAQAVGARRIDAGAADVAAVAGTPVLVEDADRSLCGEGLFHLINIAAREGGGLLLTARTRPAAWATDLPDLRSRLNALPVTEIQAPDDAVLEGVLRRFFRDRHIRPPEQVYPYLLARMNRSIPDAEEVVRALDEAGDAGFRPVTRMLARQLLDGRSRLDL